MAIKNSKRIADCHVCEEQQVEFYGTSSRCINCQKQQGNVVPAKYHVEYEEGLYEIIDLETSETVYVGKGTSLSRRHRDHLGGVKTAAHQFLGRPATLLEQQRYKFRPLLQETNPVKRGILEVLFIRKLKPIFNKQHNPRYE